MYIHWEVINRIQPHLFLLTLPEAPLFEEDDTNFEHILALLYLPVIQICLSPLYASWVLCLCKSGDLLETYESPSLCNLQLPPYAYIHLWEYPPVLSWVCFRHTTDSMHIYSELLIFCNSIEKKKTPFPCSCYLLDVSEAKAKNLLVFSASSAVTEELRDVIDCKKIRGWTSNVRFSHCILPYSCMACTAFLAFDALDQGC